MKFKSILLSSVLGALTFSSCADLDYNELSNRDEKWIFSYPNDGIRHLVDDVYAQMFNEFETNYNGAIKASATDEAVFASALSDVHNFYNGAWSPANSFSDTWRIAYRAITEANTYLEKVNEIDLDAYKYDANYDNMVLQFSLFPYEVRFLRAYYYFELVKTYGDVPLVTKSLSNAEANNVERVSADKIFEYIVNECNAIAEYLPVSYLNEPGSEIGRANRPAVLALRTRALLYMASPLFNPENKKDRWLAAAESAKELIDVAAEWGLSLSKYTDLWGDEAYKNPELIMGVIQPASNSFEKANYPVGVEGASSGNCPSQSLVDMYEYKNGKTFGEVNPGNFTVTDETYAEMDPRFGMTVVKNGDQWPSNSTQKAAIETYVGGFNGAPKVNATPTGYYLKKYVDGSIITTYNNSTTRRHTWIIWRLAEIYLNYAEAIYNYTGNAVTPLEGDLEPMTANDAINKLRERADIDMPKFTDSTNWMERYMRERAVEFAFEDQRFWDVRRWKMGDKFFNSVQEIELTRNGDVMNATRKTVARNWNDKYYFFPIPQSEILKNPKLTQNPGW